MISRTQVRKTIQKYIYRRNRTHYMKWPLTGEWSIRYYFTYDAKSEYTGKWVLKSHHKKIYIVLTKTEALEYIQAKAQRKEPQEFFSLTEFGKGYRRTVVDPDSGTDCYIENKGRK